jgi:hypothetical protein
MSLLDTAILLFGHYRTFDYTMESWKKYKHDGAKFFIHTWTDTYAPGAQNIIKELTLENKSNLKSLDNECSFESQTELLNENVQHTHLPSYYAAHTKACLSILQRLVDSGQTFRRIIVSRFDVKINTSVSYPEKGTAIITWKKIPKGVLLPENSFNDLLLLLNFEDVPAYVDSYTFPEQLRGGKRFEDILEQRLEFAKLSVKREYEVGKDLDLIRFNPLGGFITDATMERFKVFYRLARMFLVVLVIIFLCLIAAKVKNAFK